MIDHHDTFFDVGLRIGLPDIDHIQKGRSISKDRMSRRSRGLVASRHPDLTSPMVMV